MTAPLIHFDHFTFQYRAQAEPTVHDICLSIYPGEKVLIVGPSGSGKSTLAHCMNGLIPFNYTGTHTGTLTVAGTRTDQLSIFELSKIVGTVLQDPDGQFVGLTAGEDIAFALENDCVPQPEMLDRVREAAQLVGIDTALNVSPLDLSGGQKQRVSMAGVIIDRVQALLFDEPLANLDPATGKQAIDLIDRIMRETDTTVVIIEHRLEDALYRAVDRIVLMDDGRIVADMRPDELISQRLLPAHGIREPLYVTALGYAGVDVTPAQHPNSADALTLTATDTAALAQWYRAAHPAPKRALGDSLLTVDHLHFSYEIDGLPVLTDISFCIREGEMAAIVGTNGAGKSTQAKLICGFERPQSGRMLLGARDMANMTITERAEHIGYVMQNPNQMISKTLIFDEVALGLRSRGVPEAEVTERVEQTLKICGLHPFRTWPISALSFGQKKRVTIASVLVMRPKMIILDEPTAGQDFRHYTDIMEFLRSLNKQGVTVLMITHDMHLMLEYASRALVFSGGELLADLPPAKLLCDLALTEQASLRETSLYQLAKLADIADESGFVQHFIDYDREVRGDG